MEPEDSQPDDPALSPDSTELPNEEASEEIEFQQQHSIERDEAELLASESLSPIDEAPDAEGEPHSSHLHTIDDTSDAGPIADEARTPPVDDAVTRDWAHELSPQRIVVELNHIETAVREVLEGRDTKRKRKLSGTRRWRELEEDIIQWRVSGRVDQKGLKTLEELVIRRHTLFQRLNFLAGTRPTWNT